MNPEHIKLFINKVWDSYYESPDIPSMNVHNFTEFLIDRLDKHVATQVKVTVLKGEAADEERLWADAPWPNRVNLIKGNIVEGISRVTISSLPGMEVLEEEC